MKAFSFLFPLVVVLGLPSLAGADDQDLDRLPVDGYAASVNDRIITIGDVLMAVQEAQDRLRVRYGGEAFRTKARELFDAGLERLIDQALILEEFEGEEIEIPGRMIDDHVNTLVLEHYGNDRASLMAALAEEQVTVEDWRERIREQIVLRLMRSREINERIVVSPKLILEAYESRQDRYHEPAKARLRLIFLRYGDQAEQSLARMTQAVARIRGGETFETLAREISEDPSATSGGEWGWVEPEQLREELKAALQTLEIGNVSDVIETTEGMYLLLVEERKEASTKSLDEVREAIENELREQQGEELYQGWIKRLRDKYPVIYHIPTRPTDEP